MRSVFLILAIIFAAVFASESSVEETMTEQEMADHAQESMDYFQSRLQESSEEEQSLAVSLGVAGVHGVDYSQGFSSTTLKCIRGKGYKFAIPRGYRSSGSIDPNVVNNVKNAWSAGFKNVDVYIFPCPRCGNGAGQVKTLASYLKKHGVKYGMMWLDIEGTQYWGSQANNRKFFESMLSGARAAGVKIGIYSSMYQWNPIMGSYSKGAKYPLWYAHYDRSASFSDFRSFGGWSRPAIKQYIGDTTVCSSGVDVNIY
eukprot:TRINITY_DN4040_c0_g2_i1.p1 TRINITY_DN4040_c0_g2~~TRINITY_DN4040_c0_g2_i1.p1  ORF type:complete len:257 (-),score=8.12 TRINITY_DN4040_c0_g2_i1:168-938(-)